MSTGIHGAAAPLRDLETAENSGRRLPQEHEHHGQVRREEDLSSTAVVWDDGLQQWRSQDEAVEEDEADARSSEGTAVGPTPTVSAEGEKVTARRRDSGEGRKAFPVAPGTAGILGEKEGAEVIWLEWEKGDPENPFNVRPKTSPARHNPMRNADEARSTSSPHWTDSLMLSLPLSSSFNAQWSKRKKWQTALIACLFTLVRDSHPILQRASADLGCPAARRLRRHRIRHGQRVNDARSQLLARGCHAGLVHVSFDDTSKSKTQGLPCVSTSFPLGFGLGPLFAVSEASSCPPRTAI